MVAMSGHEAARVARDAATLQGDTYLQLSGMMCWDAVAHCQALGGGPAATSITVGDHLHYISTSDPSVTSAAEMRRVPQGAFIGFFHGGLLVHAMIATGHGLAAGNKNQCIGIGQPVGWEILDLASRLTWSGGGARTPGRVLAVHYRRM